MLISCEGAILADSNILESLLCRSFHYVVSGFADPFCHRKSEERECRDVKGYVCCFIIALFSVQSGCTFTTLPEQAILNLNRVANGSKLSPYLVSP